MLCVIRTASLSTQGMPLFKKIKNLSLIVPIMRPDLALWLTLNGSNYPYLEQIFYVPKVFEPLKFDCMEIPREINVKKIALGNKEHKALITKHNPPKVHNKIGMPRNNSQNSTSTNTKWTKRRGTATEQVAKCLAFVIVVMLPKTETDLVYLLHQIKILLNHMM